MRLVARVEINMYDVIKIWRESFLKMNNRSKKSLRTAFLILKIIPLMVISGIAYCNEDQVKAITKFADIASSADVDGVLRMWSPQVRKALGDNEITIHIKEKVIPFFLNHDRLTYYMRIEPRTMPDDSVGWGYYTYDHKKDGTETPFDVIVDEYEGKVYVANFNARGCVANKHPSNATCPDKNNVQAKQNYQHDIPDDEELMAKKLVMLDMIKMRCGEINKEGTHRSIEGLFPLGEPTNSLLIRKSDVYKKHYKTAIDIVENFPQKPTAEEECSNLGHGL